MPALLGKRWATRHLDAAPRKKRKGRRAQDKGPLPSGDAFVEEETELRYLERQLGLRGDSKAKAKLQKELALCEGFDDDLLDFLDGCLGSAASDPSSLDPPANSATTCVLSDDGTGGVSDVESSSDAPVGESAAHTSGARSSAKAADNVEKCLMGLVNRISEGNLTQVTAQIADRVFFGTGSNQARGIGPNQVQALSRALARRVVSSSVESDSSTGLLIAAQVAVIAALTVSVSPQIGREFLIEIVKAFERHWGLLLQSLEGPLENGGEKTIPCSAVGANGAAADAPYDVTAARRECLERTAFERARLRLTGTAFALLFDFGLLQASAIFAFLRRLMLKSSVRPDPMKSAERTRFERFTSSVLFESVTLESRLELALTVLAYAGLRLRASHPEDFRDIMAFLQAAATDITSGLAAAFSSDCRADRLDFLLEELTDLADGKANAHASSRLGSVRLWLEEHRNNKRSAFSDWSLFAFSLGEGSEGWLAVATGEALPDCPALREALPGLAVKAKSHDETTSALVMMAEKLRLHTDLQKSTFVALMGARAPLDAVQRLLEVAHKKHQIPHVVAVVMHTCLKQKVFNAFFPQVLSDLCSLPSSLGGWFKRATRQGVAAQMSVVLDFPLRSLLHFAQFVAYLCVNATDINLELRVIRFVDFEKHKNDDERGLTGKLGLFIRELLLAVCAAAGEKSDETVQAQLQGLTAMADIAKSFAEILKSQILPQSSGNMARRAEKFLHILYQSSFNG